MNTVCVAFAQIYHAFKRKLDNAETVTNKLIEKVTIMKYEYISDTLWSTNIFFT